MQLAQLLADQDGVVARRQVLASGHDDAFVERMVRRREWVRLLPGIYLDHTGRPTWRQRCWAAVLHYWPAALSHESALGPPKPQPRIPGVDPDDLLDTIHVSIEHPRSAQRVPGVRLHRVRGLRDRVDWRARPPRVRYEEALIDVATACSDQVEALGLIADACQRRRTTPARVRNVLAGRGKVTHRAWLLRALDDVGDGALSVLESGYLRGVERAHGLPRGRRQQHDRTSAGSVFRDVLYAGQRLLVELDGRVGHELFADRAGDQSRDLVAATADLMTLRLGWRLVQKETCTTAARVAEVLARRGWTGTPRACCGTCRVPALWVGSSAPGAGDPTR